jgi:hypothetical protein
MSDLAVPQPLSAMRTNARSLREPLTTPQVRGWTLTCQRRPPPRGRATATTSVTFSPQFEQSIRGASATSVTRQPTSRASASGSMWRDAPHGQVTRTRNCSKQSSSLMT